MSPFIENNSGAASSLFGALNLGIAFLILTIGGKFSDGGILNIGFAFLLSALLTIPFLFIKNKKTIKS